MTVSRVCYCTREMVKAALDFAETARANSRVDRAVESASVGVEGLCNRVFWPQSTTRYWDWPNDQYARPWRLWLDQHDLISVTSLAAGGVSITADKFNLEPQRSGPPYRSIELRLDSTAVFGGGPTPQRNIAVTGVFGWNTDTDPAGATAEAVDLTETGIDVTDSATIGVGDLVLIDAEYMLVTDKQMLSTGQTLQAPLTAAASGTSVSVSSGAAYVAGETLLVDSERLLVEDIAGNTLTVRRGFDGSVLAAHTGSTIYAPRTLVVTRGFAGTAAATHPSSAAVRRHRPPPQVRDLALAYAVNQLLQETAGYARIAGTGETARELTGRGIQALEDDVYASYGRKARTRAV